MPTVKNELDRTARGFAKVIAAGLGVFAVVGIAWEALGLPTWVMAVSVGGFLVGLAAFVAFLAAGVRCPRCGERVEEYYRKRLLWWADIRYCPQCGLDFHSPAPTSNAP